MIEIGISYVEYLNKLKKEELIKNPQLLSKYLRDKIQAELYNEYFN